LYLCLNLEIRCEAVSDEHEDIIETAPHIKFRSVLLFSRIQSKGIAYCQDGCLDYIIL